jgi:hypothetical protein
MPVEKPRQYLQVYPQEPEPQEPELQPPPPELIGLTEVIPKPERGPAST